MNYFKINDKDFSMYVNKLEVNKNHIYNARQNAAGNTIVKYLNSKRTLTVGIITLDAASMQALQQAISNITMRVTYLNPETAQIDTIKCILDTQTVDYYTIQNSKVQFKAFTLTFIEQ